MKIVFTRTFGICGALAIMALLSGCCQCADDSPEARKGYAVGFNSTSECTLSVHGPEERYLTFDCKDMDEDQAKIIFIAPCKMPLTALKDHGFTKARVDFKGGSMECNPKDCSCESADADDDDDDDDDDEKKKKKKKKKKK